MSLAPASSRGFFLNARLAVNGIQCAARSLGTLTAAAFELLSSMVASSKVWGVAGHAQAISFAVCRERRSDAIFPLTRADWEYLPSLQVRRGDPEHFALGILGVEPEQRQLRARRDQRGLATADLAQQPALRVQMRLGLGEDTPDDIDAVGAAVEGKFGLGAAFARQGGHAFGIDIGRVGDDEVVALAGKRGEQIAAMQRDAILQPVIADIACGDRERIL